MQASLQSAAVPDRGLQQLGRLGMYPGRLGLVLVVTRFAEDVPDLLPRAERALAVLAVRPGYIRGRGGRSTDTGGGWVLVTEWESVGSWRRALSSQEVKLHAMPLLALSFDEPSAYEVLLASEPGALPVSYPSDRVDTSRDTDVRRLGST